MSETGSKPAIAILNSASAPFIYFDHAPAYGVQSGVVQVEIVSRTLLPDAPGVIRTEIVASGHIRCSPEAARELINALREALALLEKPTDPMKSN